MNIKKINTQGTHGWFKGLKYFTLLLYRTKIRNILDGFQTVIEG